jgi:hypothetical protein
MQRSRCILLSRLHLLLILWGVLVLVGACAEVPAQKDWIKTGETTREEVVKRYGQPDLVMASEDGETAIYRPRGPKRPAPQAQIPTMQAGPLGRQPPGWSLSTWDQGAQQERPEQEPRIHYAANAGNHPVDCPKRPSITDPESEIGSEIPAALPLNQHWFILSKAALQVSARVV